MTRTPHDHLAKAVLSDLKQARAFFRSFLPRSVVRRVDFDSLAREPGSFVDDALSPERFSDLLFSARVGEQPVLLYLLFEHQSTPDRWLPQRILRITIRVQDEWHRNHEKAAWLPAVLPLVLYNGRAPWNHSLCHRDLLYAGGRDAAWLDPLVPDLCVTLVDLSAFTDAELRAQVVGGVAFLTLAMLLLKGYQEPDLLERLGASVDLIQRLLAEPTGLRMIETLLIYVFEAGGENVTPAGVKAVLARARAPEETQEAVMSLAEKLRREGREEGLEEGLLVEARQTLIRLLGLRFGDLEDTVLARIRGADLETVRGWLDRVLTAGSVAEVVAG